jgi:hypothetical protein
MEKEQDISTFKYNTLKESINNVKITNRVTISIGTILVTVIIFLLSSILTYEKKAYTASIDRYDYNHKIDRSLTSINANIDKIYNEIDEVRTFATYVYSKDSAFYNNEFLPNLERSKSNIRNYIIPAYNQSLTNEEKINDINSWRKTIK